MIAAQPVQAGFCDLDLSGASSPAAAMHHGSNASESAHDCCQTADTDTGSGCLDMPCGACAAGVLALLPAMGLAALLPNFSRADLGEGLVTPSHASPPFRPPISIS